MFQTTLIRSAFSILIFRIAKWIRILIFELPGGLIEGAGNIRYAQTMAFTTVVFFNLFNVFNARSDEQSAFVGLFSNHWLWGAILLSLLLQAAVIYIPFTFHFCSRHFQPSA